MNGYQKLNSYSNNALPVPTPVLTGSGSLGPSVKRSQALSHPKAIWFFNQARIIRWDMGFC